jgi:hypothetical protein
MLGKTCIARPYLQVESKKRVTPSVVYYTIHQVCIHEKQELKERANYALTKPSKHIVVKKVGPRFGLYEREWTFRAGAWCAPVSRPSILHQDLCQLFLPLSNNFSFLYLSHKIIIGLEILQITSLDITTRIWENILDF